MNQLKCPGCGSIDFFDESRFFICQYCGGRIEKDLSRGASQVSSSKSVEKIIARADMYWNAGKRDKAKLLYRQVLDIDATNEKARMRSR